MCVLHLGFGFFLIRIYNEQTKMGEQPASDQEFI